MFFFSQDSICQCLFYGRDSYQIHEIYVICEIKRYFMNTRQYVSNHRRKVKYWGIEDDKEEILFFYHLTDM